MKYFFEFLHQNAVALTCLCISYMMISNEQNMGWIFFVVGVLLSPFKGRIT